MSDQCNDSHLGEYLRKGSCAENDQPDIINATLSVFGNAYIRAATSENTRKAYRSDIRNYEKWGGILPATTEQIISYLQASALQLNPRTLTRRLTAIKQWHIYQGFSDPTEHALVTKTLAGIANTHGKPKNKALAITADVLCKIVAPLQQKDSLIALRDNALLQVGFFGAFRRSELVGINLENINFSKSGMEIIIPRSKSDQQGKGQICALPYGNEELCPVLTLTAWLQQSHITEGPIFRKINRWNKIGPSSLTPLAVNQILKKRALESGLTNAQALSSHSLRRGLATSASLKGASLKAIMRQGRWQHVNTVLGYIEDSQRFNDNAADAVLRKDE